MTTILVPVDGSAFSIEAVKTAVTLAKQLRTHKLHILTVVTPLAEHMSELLTPEKIATLYEDERHAAMQAIVPLLTDSGLDVETVWQAGPVAKTIADYAHTHDIDHIFMGTRGLGVVSAVLLGSVTNKVLSLTSIPVTLIKTSDNSQDTAFDFLEQSTVM